MTHRMLRILALTDGKTSIAEICQTLDLTDDALFADLQKLHEMHLVRIQTPPAPKKKAPARTRKGVFRGAAFEVSVNGNGKAAPDAAEHAPARVMKGVFRGAAFDVAVDEKDNIIRATVDP